MNEGYKSGGTIGGKWGCALAAIVGVPILGFVILLSALGDCAPDVSCRHDLDWLLILAALADLGRVGNRRGCWLHIPRAYQRCNSALDQRQLTTIFRHSGARSNAPVYEVSGKL
ncbi:hypothetical protein [Sphingomonas pokkalii]|uniref:hypothetical protein n=1 Tax=Sphingomonas pokkalii TaxID=2175090 RepID=UPI001057975E|nr:hypothetical protein [Sphingomonas pokkalii]